MYNTMKEGEKIDTKVICFWSPVSRCGNSVNSAMFISYLSDCIDEIHRAVIISTNVHVGTAEYLINSNIKEGLSSLIFLQQNNSLTKEDVLSYTHKVDENIDILGFEKTGITFEVIKNAVEILSLAYEYIVIDISSEQKELANQVISNSNVTILSFPQDKYLCEKFVNSNMNLLDDKNKIILISKYNPKDIFDSNKASILFNTKIYTLSENTNITKNCYDRNIYSYICKAVKKNNTLKNELVELFNGVYRIINCNFDESNIFDKKTHMNQDDLNKSKVIEESSNSHVENEAKIIKEYRFIKAKNNIGIINLSPQAGSTFISLNLASILSEKKLEVSIVEIPIIPKYDLINMINKNQIENYSLQQVISENHGQDKMKMEDIYIDYQGIKMFINQVKIDKWTEQNNVDYLNIINKSSSVNIYDIGSLSLCDKNINYLLNFLDTCVIVVDPLPYRILQSDENMKLIKSEISKKGIDAIYVLNKYTQEVKQKDIEKYLNIKFAGKIPFIYPEIIYNAAYTAKVAIKVKNDTLFMNSLESIINKANIAVDIEKKKKQSIFNILIGR